MEIISLPRQKSRIFANASGVEWQPLQSVRCSDYHNLSKLWLIGQGWDQAEGVHELLLCFSAVCGVNSGGVDATVSEDICKAGNVMGLLIVGPGKKVSEVVGEHFPYNNPC